MNPRTIYLTHGKSHFIEVDSDSYADLDDARAARAVLTHVLRKEDPLPVDAAVVELFAMHNYEVVWQ